MMKRRNFMAVLAATTCLTAGAAYAADQAMKTPPAQAALTKDAGKLSADGSKAYVDVALTRLAIFDGRTGDALKFVKEADAEFDKAKTDDSVFLKAEADLKSPDQGKGAATANSQTSDATNAKEAASDKSTSDEATSSAPSTNRQQAGMAKHEVDTTPKRWLPVDAEMSLNEDFTANPQKTAAVADANKSLAKGDKQGAMEKLKLADVDIDYVMAVVPLDQTLADVHQAATLVSDGKYYEASQMLRQVQDSTRYDLLNVNGVPHGMSKPAPATPATATH